MLKLSKKRIEMGEEAWALHQQERKRIKAQNWKKNNPEKYKTYVEEKKNLTTYWRIRIKQELIEYKGGKCMVCGYDKKYPSAYDFHHRNQNEKEFSISQYSVLNRGKLIKEVDKCDLLCCRCHAELHDEQNRKRREEAFEIHKKWVDRSTFQVECVNCHNKFKPSKKSNKTLCLLCKEMGFGKKEIIKISCSNKDCENVFPAHGKVKYCSQECSNKAKRKVKERPTKECLTLLIQTIPMTKIGVMFGVSDNAVRKWARKYEITGV